MPDSDAAPAPTKYPNQLAIHLPPREWDALRLLVASGEYGTTQAETVRVLIRRAAKILAKSQQ